MRRRGRLSLTATFAVVSLVALAVLGAALVACYLVLVTVAFWWFWPVWTDGLLTTAEWLQRIWFKSWI